MHYFININKIYWGCEFLHYITICYAENCFRWDVGIRTAYGLYIYDNIYVDCYEYNLFL